MRVLVCVWLCVRVWTCSRVCRWFPSAWAALDRPPTFLVSYPDRVLVQNVPFDIRLVTNTSALVDPDGDRLTLVAALSGGSGTDVSALPSWITFVAEPEEESLLGVSQLLGSAPASAIGVYTVAIVATGGSLSAVTYFELTVIGACPAGRCWGKGVGCGASMHGRLVGGAGRGGGAGGVGGAFPPADVLDCVGLAWNLHGTCMGLRLHRHFYRTAQLRMCACRAAVSLHTFNVLIGVTPQRSNLPPPTL